MDSRWLGCLPLLLVFAAGLGVAIVEGRLRDWWGALTRREPITTDAMDELARRLVSEARIQQHARAGGITVSSFGRRFVISDSTGSHYYPSAAAAEEAVARRLRAARGVR